MQHSLKDDYANCVKNYTNQFKENSFRKLACNDFKSWPGPREETWRLSRLGTLSRKKIKPTIKRGVKNVDKINVLFVILFKYSRVVIRVK